MSDNHGLVVGVLRGDPPRRKLNVFRNRNCHWGVGNANHPPFRKVMPNPLFPTGTLEGAITRTRGEELLGLVGQVVLIDCTWNGCS